MRRILGYSNGRAIWSPNEPDCRARVSSGNIGAAVPGSFVVAYRVEAVARVPEPPRKRRRYRPGRP